MYTIHVPVEQYGFIEAEFDTVHGAIQGYQEVKRAWDKPESTGLDTKNWQRVLDTYLVSNSMYEEDMNDMSDRQRLLINEIKKSLNRIKAKE